MKVHLRTMWHCPWTILLDVYSDWFVHLKWGDAMFYEDYEVLIYNV